MHRNLAVLALIGLALASAQTPASKDSGKPVYIVTYIDVTPNNVPETTKQLQQLAADSLKDRGAIRFEILQQDGRPNHLVILEAWQNRQMFEAHNSAAHTRLFREKLFPMLGSPYDERLHTMIQ
jgi:quinol monooxygenase YgiN